MGWQEKILTAAMSLGIAATWAGCAGTTGDTPLTVRDLGPLRYDPVIRSRDGGYSGLWQGKSYWLFGDTVTSRPAAGGFCWLSNSAFAISDWSGIDRNDFSTEEWAAREPVPTEFFPWLPEEAEYNRQHFNDRVPEKERSRYAIWPGPVIAAPDDSSALLFYSVVRCGGNGAWDFHGAGRSAAIWRDANVPPQRIPMLFPPGDIEMGDAGLTADGFLYCYGCDNRDPAKPIRLGRVRFDEAGDRSRWEFFAGNGTWSNNAADAIPLFDGASMLSVHWNAWLGRYMAIYTVPLENRLVYRLAEHPEGPWSEPVLLAECLPSTGACGAYAGLGHGELARDGGRIEYVTYYRDTGPFQGEIRLLEVTFSPESKRKEDRCN